MRLAIVVPFSWSFHGGVLGHADAQARALRRRGVDVALVCGLDPPGLRTSLVHLPPPRTEEPPAYIVPVGRTLPIPANRSTATVVYSPAAAWRMRRLFAHEQFDVVHVHDPFAPLLSPLALALADCPVVATCHAGGSRLTPLGSLLFGRLVRRLDYRIAVSEEARRSAEPHVDGPIEVIPNGVVLPERPVLDGRANHLVFVGRPDERKGLDVLLRAWPGIRRETGARLRVVGPAPRALRDLQTGLGLAELDGVDAVGPQWDGALAAEIASARLLVAPSLGRESFGMILVEAFAAATPVVASRIPGYEEVVTPETGVLVPPGDPEKLGWAVTAMLADEPARRARGAAGRAVAEERYDWEKIADRLLTIYGSLTSARAPASR